jgi:hypothetical protein
MGILFLILRMLVYVGASAFGGAAFIDYDPSVGAMGQLTIDLEGLTTFIVSMFVVVGTFFSSRFAKVK